jgi:hypothetical protein
MSDSFRKCGLHHVLPEPLRFTFERGIDAVFWLGFLMIESVILWIMAMEDLSLVLLLLSGFG